MEPYIVNAEIVAYITHLKGGGYCLAGADDLVLPVYLYNPRETFYRNDSHYEFFLQEIAGRTNYLRNASEERTPEFQQYEQRLAERASFWQDLINGKVPVKRRAQEVRMPEAEPVKMELNLTSKWNQNSPYKNMCPLHPHANEHTVVGCNATAQAQIMYYWKWPDTGVGREEDVVYEYRWTDTWKSTRLENDPKIDSKKWAGRLQWVDVNGGELQMNGSWDLSIYAAAQGISDNALYRTALSNRWENLNKGSSPHTADFGSTTYNWSIMKDTHPATPAGDAEVAELSYHAGVSSKSTYGLWWTSSRFERWELDIHFRYDSDITFYPERNDETVNYLTEEIQWLRPVALGGTTDKGGGHAYVLYGYNKGTDLNREFLMNMGRSGVYYVWYSLDSTPYHKKQDHLIRIAPLNVVKFVGSDNPGDGSPDDPYEDIEEAIINAPDGATLIFKAGSINIFSTATLVINKPLIL
ncbi:MAG: C10 family peptidase [Methanomassiliicoccales archaeon]|nr:MAG: C10 family peptidase [Methanomassiliicoccales archaeon]